MELTFIRNNKFSVCKHPYFENKLILKEVATGGIMKTGTKQEIIEFCNDKLAYSKDEIFELLAEIK